MPSADTITAAREWLEHDPDPATREELGALIEARAAELSDRFAGPLAFGTAGLRGVLGAGESRMNRAVIRRTTAGLARYLLDHHPDARDRGVVVGYDGRRQSEVFAHDTAAVLCAAGIPAWLSDGVCPTPIAAFAVERLGAVAGVMVTASHNPPEYNGYKAYAANAAQIIPPADQLIAQAIAATAPADAVGVMALDQAREQGLLRRFGTELDRTYLEAVHALYPASGGDRDMTIVYTALHGVGAALLCRAMAEAGFTNLVSVPAQAEPDGEFPTVSFPNPEEKGALDLALDLARERNAALVLANDPDADRLAVAVRTGPGQYTKLTGNEVGVLLGHHLLIQTAESSGDRLVIESLVSSPLLGIIARAGGVAYHETLTGFKWIANKAMQLEAEQNKRFIFGYEEAIGYTVGTLVRDKDGISTAVVLATMAAELHAVGQTLLDRLAAIWREHGLFTSSQRSVKFPGSSGHEKMAQIMAGLRASPPATIGDHRVVCVTDCQRSVRQPAGASPEPIDLPQSNVLVYDLEGGHRVIARPSGTEPKLKIYFDVREPLGAGDSIELARRRAGEHTTALETDMLHVAGLG